MEAGDFRASIDLALEPARAFELLVEELISALARRGIVLEPSAGGRVTEGAVLVGRVVAWEPGERIVLEWRPAHWEPQAVTEVELRCAPIEGGAGGLTRAASRRRDDRLGQAPSPQWPSSFDW